MENKNSEKPKDFFTQEMTAIYNKVVDDPSYTELEDNKLRERIAQMQELRMREVVESNDPEVRDPKTAAYYSSLSFRTRDRKSVV